MTSGIPAPGCGPPHQPGSAAAAHVPITSRPAHHESRVTSLPAGGLASRIIGRRIRWQGRTGRRGTTLRQPDSDSPTRSRRECRQPGSHLSACWPGPCAAAHSGWRQSRSVQDHPGTGNRRKLRRRWSQSRRNRQSLHCQQKDAAERRRCPESAGRRSLPGLTEAAGGR